MTQQKRKFKLKLELEFSRHFDTKTLQIRRHLKLDFGVYSGRVFLIFLLALLYCLYSKQYSNCSNSIIIVMSN